MDILMVNICTKYGPFMHLIKLAQAAQYKTYVGHVIVYMMLKVLYHVCSVAWASGGEARRNICSHPGFCAYITTIIT